MITDHWAKFYSTHFTPDDSIEMSPPCQEVSQRFRKNLTPLSEPLWLDENNARECKYWELYGVMHFLPPHAAQATLTITCHTFISSSTSACWYCYHSQLCHIHFRNDISKVLLKNKGGGQKKKVVILLQPPSIYLPTPIGVQKATFLFFF